MFELKFLKSTRKTFLYLALIMALSLIFVVILMAVYGDAYYTCCSDDLLQYFKISEDFITKIKSGNNSFYNFNNYLGASFFSDTYYVPLDIFTFITFVLSFFMNYEIAFGITEVIKLFLGTLMFGYFLKLRKCSNKAIFVASLIYFICGYSSVMMAFSAFFSLVFYYPFSAVCLEKYKKGNKLLLPLCAAMLLFYNFYLGACTMLFMGVWFILSYFLDNRLDEVKNRILKVNPNCKHVTSKAILIYLRNGFAQGLLCAGYMIVGILIACVILLPSISYFLKDSFPRSGVSSKWSFTLVDDSEAKPIEMYARILGNLFTPTYSTDFYGFINDYITDHNSLYITITGLLILLYVFKLKDRDSKIFKVVLILEVIFLMFPIFYMLFSLNGAPYTRWFGMLNMFNLLIVAHVITKTNLDLKLLSLKSLITGILTIICLVLVLNYYLERIYSVNIIELLSGKERNVNVRLEQDLFLDVIMMLVALGIILILSVTSNSKIRSKFNLMPYVLAAELVVGFVWMFGPKTENYNTIYFSDRKTELNSYLDTYLDIPYNGEFSRTSVKSYITDDYVYADNYSRTNLHLSDLRVFHSFYDYNANDLAKVFYDSASDRAEERGSKLVLNGYSMYAHQILGTRYVVVDSGDKYFYLPEEYYELINDNEQFASYEVKNYTPFMIYSEQMTKDSFSIFANHTTKQGFMLNYICLDGDLLDDMPITSSKITGIKRTYYKTDNDLFDEETNMAGYDVTYDESLPQKGFMHFYFNGGSGTRSMAFQEVILEYSDGRRENAFSGYAFYKELPTRIWVYANGDYNDLSTYEKNLIVEYNSYSLYEEYLTRMQNYSDLSLKMDGSSLHLSYHRDNDEKNIVVVPVTYNECWKCDNYETVKTYGGLLGVIISEGSNDIKLTLTFKPRYINGSALISLCGIMIYGLMVFNYSRRLKEDEENCNYCSLL